MINLQEQLDALDFRIKDTEDKIGPLRDRIAQLDEKRAVAQELLGLNDGEEAGLTFGVRKDATEVVQQVDAEKPPILEKLTLWSDALTKLREERKKFPFEALKRQKEVERLRRKLAACR
jgi:chromosome segregation ATPase